jgi:hypothetical protein
MTRSDQAFDYGPTHPAHPDESDFHCFLPDRFDLILAEGLCTPNRVGIL